MIVTCAPGSTLVELKLEIVAVATVNGTEFDENPLCCTSATPETAFAATVATTCELLQLTTDPGVLPSHTVPDVAPKPDPKIVTCVPAEPDVGDTLMTLGTTVKFHSLLSSPPALTNTGPELAPEGTFTVMLLALQLVGVAAIP